MRRPAGSPLTPRAARGVRAARIPVTTLCAAREPGAAAAGRCTADAANATVMKLRPGNGMVVPAPGVQGRFDGAPSPGVRQALAEDALVDRDRRQRGDREMSRAGTGAGAQTQRVVKSDGAHGGDGNKLVRFASARSLESGVGEQPVLARRASGTVVEDIRPADALRPHMSRHAPRLVGAERATTSDAAPRIGRSEVDAGQSKQAKFEQQGSSTAHQRSAREFGGGQDKGPRLTDGDEAAETLGACV
jgi:hypothetical protein